MFTFKVTNAGKTLLTDILNGDKIKFTVIKMGSGAAVSNVATATNLTTVKQTLTVARSSKIDFETVIVGANLMGTTVTSAFSWTECGVFAKNETKGTAEVMFSYAHTTNPSYIPVGGEVTEMLIDVSMKVGNAANVNITLSASLIFPTQADLNTAINTLSTSTTNSINTVTTNLNTHINNKTNPHTVTKDQVGLGSVMNAGVAATLDATAGVSNSLYMTPIRTKEAVTAYGVVSDGNTIIKVGGTQPATQAGKTIIWIDTSS